MFLNFKQICENYIKSKFIKKFKNIPHAAFGDFLNYYLSNVGKLEKFRIVLQRIGKYSKTGERARFLSYKQVINLMVKHLRNISSFSV